MPRLGLLVLAFTALLVPAVPADARKPDGGCRKGCRQAAAACRGEARSGHRDRIAGCRQETNAAGCRRAARTGFRAGRKTCSAARRSCRACCRADGSACTAAPVGEPDEPLFSGTFPVPDRRLVETLPLPPAPDGIGRVVLVAPDGAFHVNPLLRSPVSAAAECATVLLACHHPRLRDWAGCFANVPVCPTDTPFLEDGPMCCPAGCAARFQALRAAGLDGPTAVTAALWDAPSCVPRLDAMEGSS